MNHVIIVDDHELMIKGISSLIDNLPNYKVIHALKNGRELQEKLQLSKNIPDIILLDINMPVMNGYETMEWLGQNHKSIPVIAITINDDDESILKMLRLGVKGYLLKDTDEEEMALALNEVLQKGFYHSDLVNTALRESLLTNKNDSTSKISLKERELEFLQLACSDKTYQQIADIMCLSPKTVDHYRNDLFEKFQVKSRIGLVLFALKYKLVNMEELE